MPSPPSPFDRASMPITTGRTYLAIPGPSVSPDRVLNAMHRTAPNIYEGEIVDMVRGHDRRSRRVAMTEQHVAIYIANGHGAWEAANCNMFSRGDRALLAATGRFGHGWAECAAAAWASRSTSSISAKPARPIPQRIADALRADTAPRDPRRAGHPCRYGLQRPQRPRRHPRGHRQHRAIRPCWPWTPSPRSAATSCAWTNGASTCWSAPARRA